MTAIRRLGLQPRRLRRRSVWGAGMAVALALGTVSLASPALATPCGPASSTPALSTDVVLTFTNTTSCTWTVPTGVTSFRILVVSGGGGGANDLFDSPGAGGSGGLTEFPAATFATATVAVVAGQGGAAGGGGSGSNGQPSSIDTYATSGGGGGGGGTAGLSGGSGGGGGGAGPFGLGGAGVPGQGHSGASSTGGLGGGGGGASTAASGAIGGNGVSNSVTGAAVTYARGGDATDSDLCGSSIANCAAPGRGLRTADSAGGYGYGGDSDNSDVPQAGSAGVVIVRYALPVVAPDVPLAPTAIAGDAQATVTVVPATTGTDATGYTVRSIPGGFTCPVSAVSVATGPALVCDVTGLTNGTPYTFESKATNDGGDSATWSPVSNSVTPTLAPPHAPGIPTTTIGDGQITLVWAAPGAGRSPVSYTAEAIEAPGQTCTVTAPILTCIISGLTNGTSYTFRVEATNGGGSTWGLASTAVIPALAPPGIPGVPTAVAGNGQAVVSFAAPTDGGAVLSYEVTLTTDLGKVCTVLAPGLSCTMTGLTNGTPYTFQVRAINATSPASGWAGPSIAVTPTAPPSPPAAPTSVTAVGGTASIAVSWTPVSGATGYTATASPGPSTCTTTGNGAVSCVLGAVAGTLYTISVVAHSSAGDSAASVASATINATVPVTPPVVPVAVPITLTTDKGQIALATPGQQIIVIGTGFAPYSSANVIIYSTPVTLGTVITDGTGGFSVPVTVPPDLAAGVHTFLASGVDPSGGTRLMALPVTVAPTNTGSTGGGTGTGTGTLPIPTGGSITLLDSAGLAVTMVTVPEGTYALDAVIGIISFVPIVGFTGTATPVHYRITDAIGTVITGTFTAVVTKPAPPSPPAGKPTVTLPIRVIAGTGKLGTAAAVCKISSGAIAKCTVTVTARVSGRTVTVGSGRFSATAKQTLRQVNVKATLTALGRSLTARPGGARFTFTGVITQRGRTTTVTARGTTTVLASSYVLPRSVHFSTDAATVGKADTSYLKSIRSKLTAAKVITCVGHADSRGSSKAAQTLGTRRAKAACAIIAKGLHATVHTASKGDKAPTGKNNTAAGRARNRRVDITIHN